MYNLQRLEWHLGDELVRTPQSTVWSCRTASESFDQFNRLAVALAKSQDHRAFCGVFTFGQCNAVRQWLRLRYPDTRRTKTGNVGLVLERGGEIVWNSAMRWHGSEEQNIEAQANYGFDHGKAVLCSNIHQRAVMNRYKKRVVDYYKDKTANEIASLIKQDDGFMQSEEWFVLKAKTIFRYGCKCMNCKKQIKKWMQINVDHIKPRKFYPHLQNDPENLQILCGLCNKNKGNKDVDYR